MADTPQTYANHRRNVPLYLLVYLLLLINVIWSGYQAVRSPSGGTAVAALTALALALLSVHARGFALTVQNRIVRLEMRLRLREVLPASMHSRIGDFSLSQLVGLRFASDAELPALAERVLRDNIQDREAIKRAVTNWQADHLRV